MALMPKRVLHRKQQRGRIRGQATRGNTVSFGEFGLQSADSGWLSARHIEAGRVAATHYLHREGRVYIRVFPDKPTTKKPLETMPVAFLEMLLWGVSVLMAPPLSTLPGMIGSHLAP